MHRHRHILHFLRNRELNELYISIAIRIFALSMIGVFVPIYLMNLGHTFASVMLFYAVLCSTHVLCVFPAAKFSSRFGFKHTILFSIPFLILFYAMLYTIEQYMWPLYVLGLLFGINNAFFWIGYHMDFARFSDRGSRGEEVGLAKIAFSLFSVAGPLAGGLILEFTGFSILFILVSVSLILSVTPLFFSHDVHEKMEFPLRSVFSGQSIRDFISYLGRGMEHSSGVVVWPVFIFFFIFNDYLALGFVSSLSLLFSLFFAFVVGRFSDIDSRLILRLGGLFNAAVWALRAIVRLPLHVYITDSLYGMSQSAVQIPFDALNYDKANMENRLRTIMFREISINMGGFLLYLIMFLAGSFILGFTIAGGASLLYLLF